MNLDGAQLVDKTFQLSVDDLFNLVFANSPFFQALLASRQTYNLSVEDWTDLDRNGLPEEMKEFKQSRKLQYTMDMNQPMAKKVVTTEVQYLYSCSIPGQLYVIKSEASNMGFPLASSFRVDTVFSLTRGETDTECNLQVYAKVVFKKSAWGMKSLIEDSTIQGLNSYLDDLTRFLLEFTQTTYKTLDVSSGAPFLTHNPTTSPLSETIAAVACDPLSTKLSNSLGLRKRSSSTSSSSLSHTTNLVEQKLSSCESVLKARHRDHSLTPRIHSPYLSPEPNNNQTVSFLIRTVFILLVLLTGLNFFLYMRLLRLEDSAHLLRSLIYPDLSSQSASPSSSSSAAASLQT